MKTYQGRRLAGDRPRVTSDQKELPIRRDLAEHSYELDWGPHAADGSAAQLALALLVDYMCDVSTNPEDCVSEAMRLHQQFKVEVVQRYPHDRWLLTTDQIRNFLRRTRGQIPN